MVINTAHGLARRLGFGLGRVVRFFIVDESPALRWSKRVVFTGLIAALLTYFGSGILSVVVILLVSVLVASMLAKSSGSDKSDGHNDAVASSSSDDTSLWDTNGSGSLWHGEDERRKR